MLSVIYAMMKLRNGKHVVGPYDWTDEGIRMEEVGKEEENLEEEKICKKTDD